MMMTTDAVDVVVRHRVTQNFPKNDLFIEIDDINGNPISAFTDSRSAGKWLEANGFRYIEGTGGVWTRKRKGGFIVVPRFDAKPEPRNKKTDIANAVILAWIFAGLSFVAWIMLG